MSAATTPESRFPNEEQTLLLRAALLAGDDARAAFRSWRSRIDPMALDSASFHLLPQLARNLLKLGEDDGELERWKGTYRRAFAFNELLFNDLGQVARAFADAGIGMLVLGEAALVARLSPDSGLRTMSATACLVAPADAGRAFALLLARGWKAGLQLSQHLLASRRGQRFFSPERRGLDLRWHLLAENCHPGADEPVWKGAQAGQLGALALRTPCAADLLLQVCVDGLQHEEAPQMPWPSEAFALCASGEIDWERLATEAARRRVVLPLRTALRWIHTELGAAIPAPVLALLDALPVSARDQREFAAKLAPWRGAARLRIAWSHHARTAGAAGLGRVSTLARFFPYVQGRLGVEHAWQVPSFVFQHSLQRLRRLWRPTQPGPESRTAP